MRQIAEWLDAIGLAKYQTVFADNEIDWSLLPKLTDADLKELGLPLGSRKKLLEAVANLGTPTVGASADKPREAERRQVTVMFSDLVRTGRMSRANSCAPYSKSALPITQSRSKLMLGGLLVPEPTEAQSS